MIGLEKMFRSEKLCDCGCQNPVPLANRNDKRRGHIKGEPVKFIHGHNLKTGLEEDNHMWKGDKVSYKGIHKFINRRHPRIGICEFCLTKTDTQYASKNHVYTRNRADYYELCFHCHIEYDVKNNREPAYGWTA